MELEYGTDFSYWYHVDQNRLHQSVREKFHKHHYDEETEEFVVNACNISYFKHVSDNFFSLFLVPFLGATSRNAILNRGVMFVGSSTLFQAMLEPCPHRDSLLDIGAGSGNVTEKIASGFTDVFATETCPQMVSRLTGRGYTVLGIEDWVDRSYSVISCLNVLDRCHRPMEMLQSMYSCLKERGGMAIIALVLPYNGSVEEGQEWVAQEEPLEMRGISFEQQLSYFCHYILEPMGFQLSYVTKVPYLCTGDLHNKYYSLSDGLVAVTVPPEDTQEEVVEGDTTEAGGAIATENHPADTVEE